MESINTTNLLKNLYSSYIFRTRHKSKVNLSTTDKLRWLGGMEAYLIELNVLQSGIPFHYKKIPRTIVFFTIPRKETYEELILRNVNEHLTKSI